LIAAWFFFLQDDGGAGAAAPAAPSSAIAEMLHNSGPVALCVLGALALASIYSWTVILSKISAFSRATKQSRLFLRAFRKATRLQEIVQLSAQFRFSPMAQVFDEVYESYKRQTGGFGPPRVLAPLERSAQTAASESITFLERRLVWLATLAQASPFIGLFGTVMGVVDSFHGLGTAGSATLRAVAPGISEALITTAAGLFVAVPALIAYNQLSARIRVIAAATDDFCRELLNSLEEIPAARAAQTPRVPSLSGAAATADREAERGLYR